MSGNRGFCFSVASVKCPRLMHDWKAASHADAELMSLKGNHFKSVSAPVIGLKINSLLDQIF